MFLYAKCVVNMINIRCALKQEKTDIMLCLELHLYLSHYSQREGDEPTVIIVGNEFFAPDFDKDFRGVTNKQPAMRRREPYERPYGWYRFGLKVNMYLI